MFLFCSFFFAKGQVLLPAHEVPVLLLAGRVRGELDRVCGVLSLHRTVPRPRVQAFHRKCLTIQWLQTLHVLTHHLVVLKDMVLPV